MDIQTAYNEINDYLVAISPEPYEIQAFVDAYGDVAIAAIDLLVNDGAIDVAGEGMVATVA